MSKQPLFPHVPKSREVLYPHVTGRVPQAGLAGLRELITSDLHSQSIYDEAVITQRLLKDVLEGYSDLAEAQEDARSMRETGGARYTPAGYEINPDALEGAINLAQQVGFKVGEAQPVVFPPEVEEEEKLAWQMTRLEIAAQNKADMIRELEEDIRAGVADPTTPQALADIREMPVSSFDDETLKVWHRGVVRDALREGKEVPPEVLQDYPELAQERMI